jgi:Anti-sigma-28 factor, FlgM
MSAHEISERISGGTYEIDPAKVADAMLRRPGVRRLLLGRAASDDVLEPGD